MSNDRSDFTPEVRNTGLWATDSRRIAQGKIAEVVLERQGKVPPPDLSEVEVVQMGHAMQPVIGQMASESLGVKLRPYDLAMAHPREPWLKSHFDFESEDRTFLVECKNYNAAVITKYSDIDEPPRVPPADWAQCLHEAIVYGTDRVVLAVLFGGQRFRTFDLRFTEEQKQDWIKTLAPIWAHISQGTNPPPETPEQARAMWPQDDGSVMTATAAMEQVAGQLKAIKKQLKQLEEQEEFLTTQLQSAMGTHSVIRSLDGSDLVTWKQAKGSKRFSADLFKKEMPDLHAKFVVEQPGSRRFYVK
jgi:predicted phage-related endonuclease